MKRRNPRGITANRVVAAFDREPYRTSIEIGKRLGLHPAYVRKALSRNGRQLTRGRLADARAAIAKATGGA